MVKRLVKIKEVHVPDSDQAGTAPFREVEETFEEGNHFVDRTSPTALTAHIIPNAQQLRGQCVTCDRYLCTECQDLHCELDANLVCQRDVVLLHNLIRPVFVRESDPLRSMSALNKKRATLKIVSTVIRPS